MSEGFKATRLGSEGAVLLGARQVTNIPLSGWKRNSDKHEATTGLGLFGFFKDTKNTSTQKFWEFKVQVPSKTESGKYIIKVISIEQSFKAPANDFKKNYEAALKDLGYALQDHSIVRVITSKDKAIGIDKDGNVKNLNELPSKYLSTIRALSKKANESDMFSQSKIHSLESSLESGSSNDTLITTLQQDIKGLKEQRDKLEEKAEDAKEKRKRDLDEKLQDKDTGYQKMPALWWEKITGLSDPEKKLAILKGKNRLPREFETSRFGTFKTIPKYLSRKPFTLDGLSKRLEKAQVEYKEALEDLRSIKSDHAKILEGYSNTNAMYLPKIVEQYEIISDRSQEKVNLEEKIKEIEDIEEGKRTAEQKQTLESSKKSLEKVIKEIEEANARKAEYQKKIDDEKVKVNQYERSVAAPKVKRVQKAQEELKTIEARVEHLKSAINA